MAWASKTYREGEGLHSDIFRAAILMMEDGHEDAAVFRLIRDAANQVDDRAVPDREIRDAILYARLRMEGGEPAAPRWPAPDPGYRAEIVRITGQPLDQLQHNAKILPQEPTRWLNLLFRPEDFVCLGQSTYAFSTQLRDAAIRLTQVAPYEFVNPNPMTAEAGRTKAGALSAHCLDNAGPRVRLVIEFDDGSAYEHAACLRWLARRRPLELAVWSGGKSMHGWFNFLGADEAVMASFFHEAVLLGADARLWSPCQFVRLPGGRRSDTGAIQKVLYCAL